jgi:hypothetical protein
MPTTERKSDIVEIHSERVVMAGFVGVVCVLIATVLFIFRGQGALIPLAVVITVIGAGCLVYAIWNAILAGRVKGVEATCPYCSAANELLAKPEVDFRCTSCQRLIPVLNGIILPVSQVRCGYCNTLNYYSAKTEVLLCENCNRDIPISQEDGRPGKVVPRAYVVAEEDDRLYELVLVAHGNRTDDLVQALQHMLALNRNQVKQMLDELPVTLLTGIPKKKAELLKAQLAMHDGQADIAPIAVVNDRN